MWLQSCEDEEAFKLLQLSKEEQTETQGDQEDEELVVAEYESDDESKTRNRWEQPSECYSPVRNWNEQVMTAGVFAHMLRFCAAEDDTDDELVEEHAAKVCEGYFQKVTNTPLV